MICRLVKRNVNSQNLSIGHAENETSMSLGEDMGKSCKGKGLAGGMTSAGHCHSAVGSWQKAEMNHSGCKQEAGYE